MFMSLLVLALLIVENSGKDVINDQAVEFGTEQLLQARVDWQWGAFQNAEAILGLTLSTNDWYQRNKADTEVSVKAMEIELLAAIAKDTTLTDAQWSLGKLAQYIGALQMTCRDPKDFYGHNLLFLLDSHMMRNAAYFQTQRFALSWAVLADCNIGQTVRDNFKQALTNSPGVYKFGIDEASMITMALTCIGGEPSAVSAAQNYILEQLRHNETFVNEYSQALAVQALRSSGFTGVDDLIEKSLNRIRKAILTSGSTVMTLPINAMHFLPALSGTSLLDIKRTVCQDETSPVHQPNSEGNEITIKISVEDAQVPNNSETWTVTMTNGSTLFDALLLLQRLSSTFRIDFQQTSFGNSICSINDVSSDANAHTYWEILTANGGAIHQGIDATVPSEDAHYVFRLAKW